MDRLSIIYTNGYEEKYLITMSSHIESGLHMQYFKQLIENDMLKLIIDQEQIYLIPLVQIRKIIIHPSESLLSSEKGFAGFLHVKLDKDTFIAYETNY
ncbi:MAG: hypothetical protein WA099_06000 [Sulfuricurvum sp.]